MKLRNILITAAAAGFMFASADRVGVVGYTAGDYADMNTYPHKSAGQNVAFTAGDNFDAVWTNDGTTWGFSGGGESDLVNMLWSNGTYGLSFDLNMDSGVAPEEAVNPTYHTWDGTECSDGTTDNENDCLLAMATEGSPEVLKQDAVTSMVIGFGMEMAGWDIGFSMDTNGDAGGPMKLNARGACGFWAFDTMTVGFESGGNDSPPAGTMALPAYTTLDFNMYGVKDWGAATGMFAMGFENSNDWSTASQFAAFDDAGKAEAVTLITTGFSVESTLTDWCDLRIGYNKKFNIGAEDYAPESVDNFNAGVGFNYGSVQLDMTLSEGTLGNMMDNPLHYVNGRNDTGLTQSWTLSYTW